MSVPESIAARSHVVLTQQTPTSPNRVATMTRLLLDKGLTVDQREDDPLADLGPEHVLWLWGSVNWFPKAIAALFARPPERRPFVVLWYVEPLPLPRDAGRRWPRPTTRELAKIALRDPRATDVYTNYWNLRRLARHGLPDVVAVSSNERAAFLRERGFDPIVVPMGRRVSDGADLGLVRDRDVLFLGVTAGIGRRKKAIARLRREGIDVTVAGDYHDPELWGASRTDLINRYKVMLSIGRFEGTLGGSRFLVAMSCGALVVSDPPYDPWPYVPGTHFVQAELSDLGDTVKRFLDDDDARMRIAEAGHRFVTTELTAENTFATMLDEVGRRLQ